MAGWGAVGARRGRGEAALALWGVELVSPSENNESRSSSCRAVRPPVPRGVRSHLRRREGGGRDLI